jgi:acyl-CoA reductase-like NAD-dependent aldehyde dehydrogenase
VSVPVVAPGLIPTGPHPYEPRLPVPDATALGVVDDAVATLRANADAWVALPAAAKVRLLDAVITATLRVADRWTELAARHEGLDPAGREASEEAIVGPYIFMRAVRLHRDALADIDRHGLPRIAGSVRTLADGRVSARVFPVDPLDRLTYIGTTADVRMDRSVTLEGLPSTMATAYTAPGPGRVCLVLGGGNASSIAPLDVIHKLFVEVQVVILKSHPVMAHLAEIHEAALAPLVEAGVVRVVHGYAHQGAYLTAHPGVDDLHITGSDRTYEAIVFGTGPDGAERKLRDDPVLHKPFSAELGNLTPIIVVPGRWSSGELDYHADNVATMLTNNAGFNCTTSRVIVTAARWPQRTEFLDRLRRRLAVEPTRLAYYPGARERFSGFALAHPEAELFGDPADGHLPWMLIPGLSPDATGDPCYRIEAFCGVTAETPIEASDLDSFLERAVRFANDELWGTLNATVIVDPRTSREAAGRAAVARASDDLRYGTVSLNHWSAIGYGLGITPWGAYPGHSRTDIQSGMGFVHNPLMFGSIEKTVVRSPFHAWPKPIWFTSHRTADRILPRLIRFEADRRPHRLIAIGALAALG